MNSEMLEDLPSGMADIAMVGFVSTQAICRALIYEERRRAIINRLGFIRIGTDEEIPSSHAVLSSTCELDANTESLKRPIPESQKGYTTYEKIKMPPLIESYSISSYKVPGTGHRSNNDACYEKRVAKRRKKNKNKKTHRR